MIIIDICRKLFAERGGCLPRPTKKRKVCHLPEKCEFAPLMFDEKIDAVNMTVEEYETIRLIDYRGFTQAECGDYMKIARTTVQQIYNDARAKIAKCIVEGKKLVIKGGNFCLCDGREDKCGCGGCKKHQLILKKQSEKGTR